MNRDFSSHGYWVDLLGASVRFVQAGGGIRTRVLQMGDADKPALILLHGTGGHLENWARNIPALARDFRVIAFDLRWHGMSDTHGFDANIIPPLVAHVANVMDALDVHKAHVAGQSLGGWVAMQFALMRPARIDKLVLVTTQGYRVTDGAIPGYVEPDWTANLPSSLSMLDDPSYANVKARMGRILANPDRLTDEAVHIRQALYANDALREVQRQFVTEYLTGGESICQHYVTDALAKYITAPTLVYWGDKNRSAPALGEHIARKVRDGRFHCAEDCGHWAQFENAEEFNRITADFLKQQG